MTTGVVSVREAAKRLRMSPRTVRRWLLEGKLEGQQTDTGWTIAVSSLGRVPVAIDAQWIAERSAPPEPAPLALGWDMLDRLLRDKISECEALREELGRVKQLAQQPPRRSWLRFWRAG